MAKDTETPGDSLALIIGLVDITDARLLALHLEWVAMAESARNEAFNIVNGEHVSLEMDVASACCLL